MGYRTLEHRPKHAKRVIQDTSTRNRTFVQNGAHAHIAIPCWYLEPRHPKHARFHDRHMHDHDGWPSPQHPDHICQSHCHHHHDDEMWLDDHVHGIHHVRTYLDMRLVHPIHLTEEGYSKIVVAFDDKPAGLTASGRIDDAQDWVVRVDMHPMCEDAVKEDIEVPYTVFAEGTFKTASGSRSVRDVVAKGTLRILAGPME